MNQEVTLKSRGVVLPAVTMFVAGQSALVLVGLAGVILRPEAVFWFKLLVLAALVSTGIMVLAAFAPPALAAPFQQLVRKVFEGRLRSRVTIVGFTALSLLLPMAVLTPVYVNDALPSLWSFVPFSMFWPWATIGALLLLTDPARHQARSFAVNAVFSLVSLVVFAVLLEAMLQLAFPLLPRAITSRMPQAALSSGINYDTPYGARQYPPYEVVDYEVDERFGDIIAPYCGFPAEATAEPAYRVQYVRDAYGFRNASEWPEQANLIVLGDSFTVGDNVQEPFWKDITPATLALGIDGSGNIEQLLVLRQFGLERNPRVVVMAYFEGNDILDNWRFQEARQAGETYYDYAARHTPRLRYLVTYNLLNWLLAPIQRDSCPPAVEDAQGHQLVFADDYLAMLTLDGETLRQSEAFALTRQAILDTAAEAKQASATFVLAYVPQKAHAYWNELVASGKIEMLGSLTRPLKLDTSGYRYDSSADDRQTAALLQRHYTDQRDVIAEFAQDNGILFLDFTPHLQSAVKRGESLYLYGDTHWNQRGHDVARQALADFLREHGLLVER